MDKLISAFPENITEALEIASKSSFKPLDKSILNVTICGMGGSGIGGKLISKWVEDECTVPIQVVQGYQIPAYVGKNSLVIASSYSGNTEETLISIENARKNGATIIGITSGGKLELFCDENNFDKVIVPGGNPPRTALAYSMIQIANILVNYELVERKILLQIEKARMLLMTEERGIKSKAREIAEFFSGGRIPVFYGTSAFEAVLIRARQQINENSKLLCWHHVIPEMNHNELVGWGGGDERFAVLFLDSVWINNRNKRRTEITREIVTGKLAHVKTLKGVGNSFIEQSIYFINVLDWVSYYLAQIINVDPIEVDVIDYLKSELAKIK